jgi:hypothetical protein
MSMIGIAHLMEVSQQVPTEGKAELLNLVIQEFLKNQE